MQLARDAVDRRGSRAGSGVISSSITSSAIGRCGASGSPGSRSPSSTIVSECSSEMPTSSSARIIPLDSTPRSFALPSFVPSGITAPGRATATIWPAATLGAPQTICSGSPAPTSTLQTVSRSASGCGSASSTRPTTNPSASPTPTRSIRATSVPVRSNRSAISAVERSGEQYSRSHATGTLIRTAPGSGRSLSKKRRRSGTPCLQHRDPLDAHAEREALVALGVVVHEPEHVRVDHPRAEDLDPARSLAEVVAAAVRAARRCRRRRSTRRPPRRSAR